eukprot:CAMPEP_0170231544 /NCGR_PEP_ID=MMETSP0116_2-20130129/15507_1 /TAXON_ID=400756 /ORGANISM="Durinskia baltica, Strain CSIRO CS-38" /LENGTH=314 /DNA_ID=CAMNT_0010482317 /DNA_START=1 /DNA_END=946 /DNA_ORIENTATION=+
MTRRRWHGRPRNAGTDRRRLLRVAQDRQCELAPLVLSSGRRRRRLALVVVALGGGGEVPAAEGASPGGGQPACEAALVEGVLARGHLDDVGGFKNSEADGALAGVPLVFLVSEVLGLVLASLQLADRVGGRAPGRRADSLQLNAHVREKLVVPIGGDQAQGADDVGQYPVSLRRRKVVGKLFVGLFRELHDVEPKQQGTQSEDVQGPIPQEQVDKVRFAESMRPRLYLDNRQSNPRHEEEIRDDEPSEVHEQCPSIMRDLLVLGTPSLRLRRWEVGGIACGPEEGHASDEKGEHAEFARVPHREVSLGIAGVKE